MTVRFAPRALAEAKRRKTWWLKNRPAAAELFELELGAALSTLITSPSMGMTYDADVGFPASRGRGSPLGGIDPQLVDDRADWTDLG